MQMKMPYWLIKQNSWFKDWRAPNNLGQGFKDSNHLRKNSFKVWMSFLLTAQRTKYQTIRSPLKKVNYPTYLFQTLCLTKWLLEYWLTIAFYHNWSSKNSNKRWLVYLSNLSIINFWLQLIQFRMLSFILNQKFKRYTRNIITRIIS